MFSVTVLHRAAASRPASRLPALLLPRRHYATPAVLHGEEEDPQLNGYPQLPNVSRQYLPPTGWTDVQMRRNIGEPLHEREELYSMWGPDIPPIAPQTALVHFTVATLGFLGLALVTQYVLLPTKPAAAREYPFSGLITELGGLEENKARAEDESEED